MGRSCENSDEDLISRIKDGDTEAFRCLVDTYRDLSLSLAISIVKDKQKAEDVLQDVFIKVYQKIHTFRFSSTFSTWLYRIVVNTSYNVLKKDKHHHDNPLEIDSRLTPSTEMNEFSSLEKGDRKKYIHMAFERLRSDEALVLRLFYLSELKISEIEDVTGFKKSKIKVDLHRGRGNLLSGLREILGTEISSLL